MASKEEQAVNLPDEKNDEKEKEGRKSSKKNAKSHLLGAAESKKPGGNVRSGLIRRLVPNFRLAIRNRQVDHSEVGEDVGKCVRQVAELKRKTREQQTRPYMPFQTPEPDNHYDFCLIP